MAAVLLTGHGGFEKLEYREDIPLPVPGEDEVLIKVAAAGINNTDINTRIAWYSKQVTGQTGAHPAETGLNGPDHRKRPGAVLSGSDAQSSLKIPRIWSRLMNILKIAT